MRRRKAAEPWTGWGPGERAEQHYLVRPRALAGGGNLRHISDHLRACGWRETSKTGGPVTLRSPDRSLRALYDPTAAPGGWVIQGKARGHEPAWWAHFTAQTPVEIVAGLTDALTQPRAAHAPDPWAPLRAQGWHIPAETEHTTALNPDATAWLRWHRAQDGTAVWWSGAKNEHDETMWGAHLSATTPLHLVTAFASALASPEPVMRPLGTVPPSTRIRTTSVSVLPSQLHAWQQARVTAARAATWNSTAPSTRHPRLPARTRSKAQR
ncbi:DUF317 domain-containing protein [Streptomyces sp. GZWMJZ-114]|uniref:DUF317 domain-containing protein n=1 Tax=Streptomyces sp. GZWMJZ-114 TaxID=2494734 RepID=UPI001010A843|nr:DUF317 domain-containing protein [Streptomyces sp. GZWMJZ-114]